MRSFIYSLVLGIFLSVSPVQGADDRLLVEMPKMMQDHMLANMRDHLQAIEESMAALARGENTKAASIIESRLGMSALPHHGASHMAPLMPEGMRTFGTEMHRAASRFVLSVDEAEFEEKDKASQKIFQGFQDILKNCNACHEAYRIR